MASDKARLEPRGLMAEGRPLPDPPEGGAQGPASPAAPLILLFAKFPLTQLIPVPRSLSSSISRRAQIWAGCIWSDKPLELLPPLWAEPSLDAG